MQWVITLVPYNGETETACALIQGFWLAHNGCDQSMSEALEDLAAWTKEGHRFYLICVQGEPVGFVHLGSRGAAIDWLEDIFVLPQFQGRGIGSRAIALTEDIVRAYSDSLYIEAAARNERAIRLYRKIGYDCLNTVTVRKDFCPEKYRTVSQESLLGQVFEIRRQK